MRKKRPKAPGTGSKNSTLEHGWLDILEPHEPGENLFESSLPKGILTSTDGDIIWMWCPRGAGDVKANQV